jgi:pimeloyl-ACP methyl ester carboxylesterase
VQRWAQLSSSSSVVTVDETGHDIQLDQPAVVIAEVTKLLR